MKTLIVFLSLLSVACAEPAANLAGFLDVPFGANQETTKKTIRTSARLNRTKSKDNLLWLDGGRFAGLPVEQITLEFSAAGFFMAQVQFKSTNRGHEREFEALQQLLTAKYGPGKAEPGGDGQSVVWYPSSSNPAQTRPNTIRIKTNPAGVGAVLWYISDEVRMQTASGAPVVVQPKPERTGNSPSDDI